MKALPQAQELEDGSILVPAETRVLLNRVLGDVLATLMLTNGLHASGNASEIDLEAGGTVLDHGGRVRLDHAHEIEALRKLAELLRVRGHRVPPLHEILGTQPPRRKPVPLRRVK